MDPVINLLTFYTMERNLFSHLVNHMSVDPSIAKSSIALWLWLEFIGHPDLVQRISAQKDGRVLRSIISEGQSCLAIIQPDSSQPAGNNDIPITAGLIKEPISLRFFHYNRDVATHGISHFLHNVCDIICSEAAAQIMERDTNHAARRPARATSPFIAGSNLRLDELGLRESTLTPIEKMTSAGASSSQAAAQPFRLNPQAEPWSPDIARNSDDHRSMFLTFSRGYPLRREEVLRFFTSRWGNCVQTLSIERTQNDSQPMYGRVVFNNASVIPLILNGSTTAKFVVNGKHLWARLFVPKRQL
ncbi:uncharacterized protein [Aristolochia californica]|uniref:uncharacterized protein n=1 Tax=Aristolochia californica TaxID=171875 RepID=UPI0035E10B54